MLWGSIVNDDGHVDARFAGSHEDGDTEMTGGMVTVGSASGPGPPTRRLLNLHCGTQPEA